MFRRTVAGLIGHRRGDPLLNLMFKLVVSSVLIGFGVLVTALMCRIWEGKQGEEHAFHESEPAKKFPASKAA